ncbi:hypothetical protein K501DRAFT_90317 [Backusella circina FSU 941]|nr:hypothetical protein K501DRAFT_90317 [Backusella circina FSU 941]
MLADDELDFDYDLGDLGDLGDLEATGLTTEELEKELGLDLDIDLEPITEDSFKKKTPSKETPSEKPKVVSQDSKNDIKPKAITKEEDKKTDDKKTEVKKEGQDNSIKQNATPKESDQEEKKQDQLKKPERKSIPTTLDKQHNNYRNNRNFNNNNPMNFYAMQQQAMFYPQMQSNFMAMNGMFPYQQQQNFSTPNRIYVNPNFKGRNPNQMMGRQQVEETQKANNTKPNMTDEEKAREELLDQKRKEAAESLRKKLASKKQEVCAYIY